MASSPSPASSEFSLQALPLDIIKITIQALEPVWHPFHVPKYGEWDNPTESREGLAAKHVEYYGANEWSYHDIEGAEALLNWSSTCHYFRDLIVPDLFRTVVLRSKPKSARSVRALMGTRYWENVQKLVFVGTDTQVMEKPSKGDGSEDEDEDDEESLEGHDEADGWEDDTDSEIDRNIKRKSAETIKAGLVDVTEILSHLPPKLMNLVVDLPHGWEDDSYELLTDGPECFEEGTDPVCPVIADLEQHDWYRATMRTAFDAIASPGNNNVVSRPGFELQLFNITSLRCLAWDTDEFKQLLGRLTTFTLGMGYYESEQCMNMMPMAEVFAEKAGERFFDHINNVTTFKLHCDETWPFGCAPGGGHMPLELSPLATQMPRLQHVSFRQVLIDNHLILFLNAHAKRLRSIELIDCYAHGQWGSTEVEEPPQWADLFGQLAKANLRKLMAFSVSNPSKSLKDLVIGYSADDNYNDNIKQARSILSKEHNETIDKIWNTKHRPEINSRLRRVFSYAYLDDKYGVVFQDEVTNVERLLAGADHESYLKLIDIVEENVQQKYGSGGC